MTRRQTGRTSRVSRATETSQHRQARHSGRFSQVAAALTSAALLTAACTASGGRSAATRATTTSSTTTVSTTPTSTIEPATTSTTTDPTREPTSASEAAAAVTATERAIAGGDPDPGVARRQQVAYRALAAHPEWDAAAIAAVAADVRPAAQANLSAVTQLRQLTKPKAALPPWRIVAPAPAAELMADYRAAERDTGVPWNYLAAIHFVETKFGRIRGASDAGAQGPMQFLPSTWKQYGNGGDIESNHDAVEAAARLLRHNGAPARLADALFAYNHSSLYVGAVTAFAERMHTDENAFVGYYGWQVYYRLANGDRLLAEGYGS